MRPRTPAIDQSTLQLRPNPIVELCQQVFFGHDHSMGGVRRRVPAPLVDFAHATVLAANCFVGAVLVAVGPHLWMMRLGRFLFGIGGETLFVAMLIWLGQWFARRQSGIAIAVFFSVARLGSYVADLSPQVFPSLYRGWLSSLILSAVIAGMTLVTAMGYAARSQAAGNRARGR